MRDVKMVAMRQTENKYQHLVVDEMISLEEAVEILRNVRGLSGDIRNEVQRRIAEIVAD